MQVGGTEEGAEKTRLNCKAAYSGGQAIPSGAAGKEKKQAEKEREREGGGTRMKEREVGNGGERDQ